MIAPPLNDHTCLGHVTDLVRERVQALDPEWVDLAERVGTTDGLVAYLRAQPQRDDDGDPTDGPRVDECVPSQRVRLSPIPHDPNCLERGAIYLGVAELLDPEPVRQLKTAMTPAGLHTYPVENRWPVTLDPSIPRNALHADLLQSIPLGLPFTLPEAIEWMIRIAEDRAARDVGGIERLRAAHDAILAILDGAPVTARARDDLAYAASRALFEAEQFGAAGRALLRETVRALVARLSDESIPRYADPIVGPATPMPEAPMRNALSLRVGRYRISPNWDLLEAIGRTGARVGGELGAAALGTQLARLGLSPAVMSVLERELNREGATLGPLAPRAPSTLSTALHPGSLATTAQLRNTRGAPQDLAAFARTVQRIADRTERDPTADGLERGRFGRKVFIAAIRRGLCGTPYGQLSRGELDALLVRANREGLLELARADLVGVMDPGEVRDSEIRHMEARFHFVISDASDPMRNSALPPPATSPTTSSSDSPPPSSPAPSFFDRLTPSNTALLLGGALAAFLALPALLRRPC